MIAPEETSQGPRPVNVLRALSYPETVLYAPPALLVLLDLPALLLLLILMIGADVTPLTVFLIVPVHGLACSIGFREPHIASLIASAVNSARQPRELYP